MTTILVKTAIPAGWVNVAIALEQPVHVQLANGVYA